MTDPPSPDGLLHLQDSTLVPIPEKMGLGSDIRSLIS